jgi:hypothetical protein
VSALSGIIGMLSAINQNTVRLQSEQVSAFVGIRTLISSSHRTAVMAAVAPRAGSVCSFHSMATICDWRLLNHVAKHDKNNPTFGEKQGS